MKSCRVAACGKTAELPQGKTAVSGCIPVEEASTRYQCVYTYVLIHIYWCIYVYIFTYFILHVDYVTKNLHPACLQCVDRCFPEYADIIWEREIQICIMCTCVYIYIYIDMVVPQKHVYTFRGTTKCYAFVYLFSHCDMCCALRMEEREFQLWATVAWCFCPMEHA